MEPSRFLLFWNFGTRVADWISRPALLERFSFCMWYSRFYTRSVEVSLV